MDINNVYHGFKLLEEKPLKELNSIARIFEHEKSGARLFHLENQDDNKVFSISFRTPPNDSTGVPHILEHSVLCGSKKFPVKEPFVELIKGSMNTFLNAMTYPDKTMYPVASRNDKDFLNLMDVYLDAVLHPNIYKYPEIMMQEGWHYELEDKNSELTYKGVVYNEMKGALSSPDSLMMRKVQESLFPDTPYYFESGGDPDFIPDLTQEKFVEFHKKYYHPSNSYIYLYGNMDLLKHLEFIDKNYLSEFDRISVDSKIAEQPAFKEEKRLVVEYPISPSEKEQDKTFLSLNFAVGSATDAETALAFEILEHLLLETPAAPLKKALVEANLGKDVFGYYDDSALQPTFSVVVKNSNEDKEQEFKKVVLDTIEKLVNGGIKKDLIESSINIKEFQLRESEFDGYPKGLIYNIQAMNSWLYDANPTLHLEYSDKLAAVKTALTTNYFEALLKKYVLENNHRSMLIVKPKKGLAEKMTEELKAKLNKFKADLSDSELQRIIENTKKLRERQTSVDSPEDLAKIPLLSLEDLNRKAEELPLVEKTEKGVKVLHHPIFTGGIAYLNLYFDTTVIPKEKLPYLTILAKVLGKLNTTSHNYEELSNLINIHTGGIRYSGSDTYSKAGSADVFYPKFTVRAKSLVDKLPKLSELICEILGSTVYNDKKRLKEIIQEFRSRLEARMFDRGHLVAAKRVCSYFSQKAKYDELLNGLSFYEFILDLENNFDSKAEEIIDNLENISELVFNKNNLMVGITLDDKEYAAFSDNLNILTGCLNNDEVKRYEYNLELNKLNEGLMTSAKVQYVAKGYNFKKLGYEYNGSMQVLKTIAGLDYLWNKVRVLGGAYGSFARFEWSGNLVLSSYRDPNLVETLKVYDELPDYLRNFEADERELTKYVIGTVSELDYPLTPYMKGETADEYYIRGISQDDVQKERDQIINTKVSDIKGFADLVSKSMEQNCICALGNEDKLKANKDLFGSIKNIFE